MHTEVEQRAHFVGYDTAVHDIVEWLEEQDADHDGTLYLRPSDLARDLLETLRNNRLAGGVHTLDGERL